MVVGQDWGDTGYFIGNKGQEGAGNPTNTNLAILLASIGISIPAPGVPLSAEGPVVFLTNTILCLKKGGLQGNVEADWTVNCQPFLKRQVETVQPKVVVGLGTLAFESLLGAFGLDVPFPSLAVAVKDTTGIRLPTGARIFAAYHCGARGVRFNRPMSMQLLDWRRIGDALRGSSPPSPNRRFYFIT
jgi:hypothetical protein